MVLVDFRTAKGNPPVTFAIAACETQNVSVTVLPCFGLTEGSCITAKDMWGKMAQVKLKYHNHSGALFLYCEIILIVYFGPLLHQSYPKCFTVLELIHSFGSCYHPIICHCCLICVSEGWAFWSRELQQGSKHSIITWRDTLCCSFCFDLGWTPWEMHCCIFCSMVISSSKIHERKIIF